MNTNTARPPCTCSQDGGIHEWYCAIEKQKRVSAARSTASNRNLVRQQGAALAKRYWAEQDQREPE